MDHVATLEHDIDARRTTVTMNGRTSTTHEPDGIAGVLATATLLRRVGYTVTVRPSR